VAEYQTEEEQVEALKRWWEKNGKFVIIGGIVVIAGVVGGKTWQDFQLTTAGKVSAQYNLMLEELEAGDEDSATQRAQDIITKNADMHYAVLSAMMLAKTHVDKGDNDAAFQQLSWALSNTDDSNMKHVIRLRLAKVLIAQDKLGEAMTHATFPETGSFSSQYSVIKGDIYYKKGELESAKTAYKAALDDKELGGQLRSFVQIKLDDLGGIAEEGES